MNILIMRHGEASMNAPSDTQRPLTENGLWQAGQAGQCLLTENFCPDLVWLSPYLRTRQTTERVMQAFNQVPQIVQDFITPDNHPVTVIDHLQKASVKNLLLVSHQPLVSALIGTLVDSTPHAGSAMAPASMALLRCESPLPGCCDLLWLRHAPTFDVSY
ncbi:phosphohistidine phosphatase SixA [Oceanicoccus sp. KOV_DT_Chl]|uniref:phosphohistidine phosphatase SixA n=1 Tax=Oceanicoccus sp. KOV_DT_Chl TaxID=1904639 RepID=UPI000C7DB87C|nr:phosphohistidine phosphatase SixA [Oceanicoccus sp. KOV_DT_Chl]